MPFLKWNDRFWEHIFNMVRFRLAIKQNFLVRIYDISTLKSLVSLAIWNESYWKWKHFFLKSDRSILNRETSCVFRNETLQYFSINVQNQVIFWISWCLFIYYIYSVIILKISLLRSSKRRDIRQDGVKFKLNILEVVGNRITSENKSSEIHKLMPLLAAYESLFNFKWHF